MFRVAIAGTQYVSFDQYCVKPGCRCTDAHLSLLPADDAGTAADATGSFSIDYDSGSWEVVDGLRAPCDVAEFKRIIEGAHSNFYKKLQARHKKMRAIYAHCRRRELESRQAINDASLIGRNGACPCGSGKKYKKCCIGNAPRHVA